MGVSVINLKLDPRLMSRSFTLAAGNNAVSGPATLLKGLHVGNTTNSAATVALHDVLAVGDIAAANLVHTFTLAQGGSSYNFDDMLFPAGLCVVLTLNGATADVLIEFD